MPKALGWAAGAKPHAAARPPSLSPFSPLCSSPGLLPVTGGHLPAVLSALPYLLQEDQGCPAPVSSGSFRAGPEFTPHLNPDWPVWHSPQHLARCKGMLASVQPPDHTLTRSHPIHRPHPSHCCVACPGKGGAEVPGGLTFLGTVMTMGSHLRSCSL